MEANWDDLRVFLTLAREGTLTTAAKALGVSHPTVSRRVQALEQQIGARLFERLPDRFVPTSAGEELLADTEAMEKAALSIKRRSAGLSDTVSGVVRLSAGEAMAVLVARHLPWLRARLQQIEFEVVASHTLANLSRREADLLIREQVPELAGIVTRKLCHVAYAIYAARTLEMKRTAMPALVDLPWIGFDDDHSYMPGQRWMHEQLGRRPEMRVNNWLVLHDAVRSGAGLGVLPCYLADQDPRLQRVGGVLPEITTEQWLLVHRDLRALPRVRAVMDALVELFQRHRSFWRGAADRLRYSGPKTGRNAHERKTHACAGIVVRGGRRGRERRVPAGKPEEVGLSSAQLKKIEDATQEHRRGDHPRRGDAGGAPRQGRVGLGQGKREPAAGDGDEARFDLPHLLDDQADRHAGADAMVEEGRLQVSDRSRSTCRRSAT